MAFSPELLLPLSTLKERLMKSWDYHDVLALAMARAKGSEFDSSNINWSRVISDFQTKTQDINPELLDGIYFDTRDPSIIYSVEVEGFFATMRRSASLFRIWDQGSVKYRMSPEAKQDIIKGQETILQPYEEIIIQLSREIDAKLAIN